MKAEKRNNRLTAGILGSLAAFGGIGCMVTGLYFDKISMAVVAIVCVLAGAVCAATAGRRLFLIVPALLALVCLGAWFKGTLALSAEALLNHISHLYDLGYGWGIIRWSEKPLSPDMAQSALCILGILLATGVSWSFLRCRSVWLCAVLVFIPVLPCMILVDTVPSAPYLFIQLLCLALLLLTRLARKRGQGTSLLTLLALPAAAALLALFASMPREEYISLRRVDDLIGYVQEFFTDSGKELFKTPVRQESDWIDLTAVGAKRDHQTPVMKIWAQTDGYLYLKGAAYDTYQGTRWDCQDTPGLFSISTGSIYRAHITTEAVHDVFYLPYGYYNMDGGTFLTEKKGRMENPNLLDSYTVYYRRLRTYDESWQIPAEAVPQQFTQLPQSTLEAARAYLARELPELETITGVWTRASVIADHISRSAQYSLRTEKMPKNSDDFALWFLESSDTGYCIHFASAATVLLRAAGIPARYVTGYLVNTRSGVAAEVTQGNAHAWAECYVGSVGWVPLEATPGGGVTQTVGGEITPPTEGGTETVDTLPEEPSETQASTGPTDLPTDAPTENTSPIGGADGPVQQLTQTLPPWLKWGLGILCAVGAVTGQWRLRVSLRQKRRHRGKRNAQALARWQEVVLHCRVRGCEPEGRLLALAQKAKFSHHALTREELMEFDEWLNRSKEAIRQLSLFRRFLATVLFALY